MGCGCGNDKPKGGEKSFTKAVIEIKNKEKITLLRKVVIPASLGDETTIPPAVGEYHNVILVYEASKRVYIYSSDGIPTLVAIDPLFIESELERLGIEIEEEKAAREDADEELSDEIESVVSDLAAETAARIQADNALQSAVDSHTTQISNLNTRINAETANRQNADIDLQNQIDAISAASDVKDIVGTYQELQDYDTSGLGNNDIIKVLQDETQDNATTYYRWNTANQTFSLIGEEGPYYTKSETDSLLTDKQDVLEAGDNISIVGDVISATDTTYSAGNGLSLDGTTFSADTTVLQPKLTAGDNISITNNTISATDTTYTAGSGLDLTGTEFSIDNTVALKTDLPTVNNATFTVQKNGVDVASFTANSAVNATANITVPTDTAQLTNTAGYQTASDVASAISGKQDTLTPGNNIQINGTTISATNTTYSAGTGLDLTGTVFSADTDILQTKLTAGDNISISNGVISSTGPTYSAGTGIELTNNVFAIDDSIVALKSDIPVISSATLIIQRNGTDVATFTTDAANPVTANILVPTNNAQLTNGAGYQTASDVQSLISGKQDILTPGTNIQISGNTISATDTKYSAGNGLNLTGTVFSADTSVLATQTDLASKQDTLTAGTNININSNTISTQTRGIEYIVGTQTATTNAWLGTSTDNGCSNSTLYTGKTIVYHLPYAGTSTAATLNLTLPDGTTTGAKGVKYNTGGNVGTTYGAGCDIFMVYDGANWKTSAWYDSNNYDRLRYQNAVKAAAAITASRICVGTDAGYVMAEANATFDITYPILLAGTAVNSGSTSNNFYGAYLGVNLTNNKSGWSGTSYKMVFLVGTLSGTTFTIDSSVFTQTVPTTEDGKIYAPIGLAYSATNALFYPNNTYWAYKNGMFRPISNSEPVMTGADASTAGTSGLVPAPAAGDNTKYLSGDGTWKTVSQYSLPIATANDLGGIKVGNNLSIDSTTGVLDAVVPTVNNATLTIQKNGTSVGTFTANASSNKSINITVPTSAADVSALPASTKYGASISVSINTTDYKITTTLKDQDGNTLGTAQVIDLPLESVVVSGSYDSTNKKIILTLQNGNTIDIPVADLVAGLQSEITSSNMLSSDLVDDTNHTHKFVTDAQITKLNGIAAGAEVNVQSDWNQTNTSADDFIKNKPTIAQTTGTSTTNLMSQKAVTDELAKKVDIASVDLTGQTTTILSQVQALAGSTNYARFICTNNGSAANITDNPNTSYGFTCVAYQTRGTASSDYAYELFCYSNDGNNRPYYARVMHGTTSIEWKRLQPVALTGSYNDLTNKPTIPTVNNATLTIQKNGTNVATFTANSSSNATANILVPTKTSDLTNDSGFITSSGTIDKANQLATARTIGIGTGATGTATSFDGTSNITIPITDVKDAYVTWGGKSIAGSITPDDMGCIDEFGHNKLAFLPASCITVEYSTDGGSTWLDYELTDSQKVQMVTNSSVVMEVGKNTAATESNVSNLMLRVRIACGPQSGESTKLYSQLKKILINISTQGSQTSKVAIRYRTISDYKSNTDTWATVGTYDITGGSAWNSIPFDYRFGGSMSTQTNHMGQVEFKFWSDTIGTWGGKKLQVLDFRFIGETNWNTPSEMARVGRLYAVDVNQNALFPRGILPNTTDQYDLGVSDKKWRNLYMSGNIYKGSATLTVPSTTGTLALTSQIPTKTSDITNDSDFTTNATAQKFSIGQGSTNPVFDDMTPIRTFEWDVSDATYRPIYTIANTGLTYINLDVTVAYRITVTGTNINGVIDVVDRWHNPVNYPVTSMFCRTLSTSAATTGLRYLRAVYPTSSYLNNASYPLGQEIAMYNTTARHVKVEVFKDNSQVSWNTTKPSGSIYVDSTHNGNSSLAAYDTRGWRFRQPVQMQASASSSASYISDYEPVTVAVSDLKTSGTALTAGHMAFLAEDGKVYDISNTTQSIAMGPSKIGYMNSNVNANTAISATYWRAITRLGATQFGYFSHDTVALGDRLFLRCTMDANGKIHSDNYLAKDISAGYTWMPFGYARSATTAYVDTRHPIFYTINSSGKLTHINGIQVAGSSTIASYSSGTLYINNPT